MKQNINLIFTYLFVCGTGWKVDTAYIKYARAYQINIFA